MHRKAFGYKVKPFNCQLLVKENRRESAFELFKGTSITRVDGFRVLELVIGTPSACNNYMESEIEKTTTLSKRLSKIAETYHKMRNPVTQMSLKKLSFLIKTTPEAFEKMHEIEKNVRKQLLPKITGKNYITDEDRSLFALPKRMGRLDFLSNTDFFRNYEWPIVIR